MNRRAEVSKEIVDRLTRPFSRDERGRRGPVYAARRNSRLIPTGVNHILFYEYFHGDNGAGLGCQPSDRLDRTGSPSDPALWTSRPKRR